ncbi:MAG: molecular chaperone HtpG [Spirochaetales bacterium]|nr:molecular chaperone HtpG [Spirochaetales bacterium]
MSRHEFQTEVDQLLKLIIHSLYSHQEIFLRELVSNASDALDKLKYLTLTDDRLKTLSFTPRLDISIDENASTLTLSDNGIGMNEEDLNANLGTIARSGTKNFLSKLSGDAKRDSNLIGQFGVGFYSAFMVASRVDVVTRKAGEEKAWRWTSEGHSNYEIEESQRDSHGTTVVLHLNDDGKEYASSWKIRELVKKYSNHIAFPIFLTYEKTEWEGEGENRKSKKVPTTEQVNEAGALWKRSKTELKDEDYKEFYKSISHDWEDPLLWFHTRAEGTLEYTTLFYIPSKAPMDLFQADYKPGVKLYVKRVFITDDEKELLPTWLRFLRGVIDSEDLPLNVSREILQQNKILSQIKTASVKKLLGELQSLASNDQEKYLKFVGEYNRVLKEGLYSDYANREALLDLVRFKSTKVEGWTSLAQAKDRMQSEQKALYILTGGTEASLRASPLLEVYRKKDIEVLILDDEIDEIVFQGIDKYKDTDLKSINKADVGEDLKDKADEEKEKDLKPLVEKIKKVLGDRVKDVRVSFRLAESPSCIVTGDDDPSVKLQQIMKAMGQKDLPALKPILEINPDHSLVVKLRQLNEGALFDDAAFLLLEQALLIEGVPLESPNTFVARLNRVLDQAV